MSRSDAIGRRIGCRLFEVWMDMTGEHDLTLIGATREGLFQQLLFGAFPEQLDQRAQGPVIMAKRSTGITSRMKRWFGRRNG